MKPKVKLPYAYMVCPVKYRARMIAQALEEAWPKAPKIEVVSHPAGWAIGPVGKWADTPPYFLDMCDYAAAVEHGIIMGQKAALKGFQALGIEDDDA